MTNLQIGLSIIFIIIIDLKQGHCSTWSEWWTYDGISGQDFWGIVNPDWGLCSKGKRQSPIDIDPKTLLFDPNLKHIHIHKNTMGGLLTNSGHVISLLLDEPNPYFINITGGPLSYQYRLNEIVLHFGNLEKPGSEHRIDGRSYPAELQILGYNSDIYGNMTQAVYSTHGVVGIAILIDIGQKPKHEFDFIFQNLKHVQYKGKQIRIRDISVHGLLPETNDYMTYEGSTTQPGCYETATWIVMNSPIYITEDQLSSLREVMQGDEKFPKASMMLNRRYPMSLNQRPVRTNINVANPAPSCRMDKNLQYQANKPKDRSQRSASYL